MKEFWIYIVKETLHILRDRKSLGIMLGIPIMQIFLFGFALTTEVKNSQIAILDNSKDLATRTIIEKFEANRYFEVNKSLKSISDIEKAFKSGKIKLAIVFQNNFRDNLLHSNKAQIQLISDASDPNTGTTVVNYATSIINDYQNQLTQQANLPYQIKVENRMLYNPQLLSSYTFVPGVMGMILLLICAMMTSVTIVREKELNTMEVLLVSPFNPYLFIMSKAVPYVVLSLINVTSILYFSRMLFDIPINGSLLLIYFESFIFISVAVSFGLMVSNITNSQQIAMSLSQVGLMMPTLLLSGFLFPIENMPLPMQIISNIVPTTWFIIIIKGIMIKGLGLEMLWKETLIMLLMLVFFLFISFKKFSIRLK